MTSSRLEYLFDCFVSGRCSFEEEKELMSLIDLPENETIVRFLIDKTIQEESGLEMPEDKAASILQNILDKGKDRVVPVKRSLSIQWIKIAATVILFLGGACYWYFNTKKEDNNSRNVAMATVQEKPAQIVPGGNHAVLTMADGTRIMLDSVDNGKIQKGNLKITKKNGLLVFASTPGSVAKISYNTLSTPRGGNYKVILADGSEVWLNASSSLRFPTAFPGNQREVELTGEAYFEVAKNKAKPFHVKVGDMTINVLGTHFNVHAYEDENSIKTSLLEGSVAIKRGSVSGLLKPGQQAILARNKERVEIKDADLDEVMAWKNGLFQFDGADIKTIMNQIGRWYDVDIVYSDKVPVRRFEGKISRDAQLSDVLRILELSNVKFKMEGKKIIVE